jgi:hypothetical protein
MVQPLLPPEQDARRTWLERLLDQHGLKLRRINAKFMNAGDPAHMPPEAANRLNRWLEQIGLLKKREADIISEIQAIERQHHAHRQHRQLQEADPATAPANDPLPMQSEREPKRSEGLVWLAWLWAMLRDREYKKKQDLSGL